MAGYIGKSLAVGGTSVDAYTKTQSDAAYLRLTGSDTQLTNQQMVGGIRQGVLSKTADYTIQTADPNICLVTTASTNRTMTLPLASTKAGQIYRFTKIDSGTGKVIIARTGVDTMGVNANLTMELWFQDNYVDLMSDGTSRWIVMSTEMFIIPDEKRSGDWDPSGSTSTAYDEVDYSSRVPAGTRVVRAFVIFEHDATGGSQLLLRRNGSTTDDTVRLLEATVKDSAGTQHRETTIVEVEVDIDRIFEYKVTSMDANVWMNERGYKLG